jgi:hypothetical protein
LTSIADNSTCYPPEHIPNREFLSACLSLPQDANPNRPQKHQINAQADTNQNATENHQSNQKRNGAKNADNKKN